MSTNPFRNRFQDQKCLFPVLHVTHGNFEKVVASAQMVVDEGATGVFLINHSVRASVVTDRAFQLVRRKLPKAWIGINLLGENAWISLAQAIRLGADGVWFDYCGADAEDHEFDQRFTAERQTCEQRLALRKAILPIMFGGAAFKYLSQEFCPKDAAVRAMSRCDVVTTSGTFTASAPKVEKIRTMRRAIAQYPLAIASGISAENIGRFARYTDAFLVASSIEREIGDINPRLFRELRRALTQATQ